MRRVVIVGGLALLLALALRLPRLGESLWSDEIVSATMAGSSWSEMVAELEAWDPHPPLFYTALRFVAPPPASEARQRMLPLLLAIAHLVLLAWIARRLLGMRAAWVTLLLAAVSWELVWTAFELRSFSMANFFCTLAWLAAVGWIQGGRRAWLVVFALASAAAVYSFYYAAVALVALVAVFVPALGISRRRLAWLGIAACAALLLFLPWWPVFARQYARVAAETATGYGTVDLADAGAVLGFLEKHVFRAGMFAAIAVLAWVATRIRQRPSAAPGRPDAPDAPSASERAPATHAAALRATGLFGIGYVLVSVVACLGGSFTQFRAATMVAGVWCVFAAGIAVRLPRRWRVALVCVLVVWGFARSARHAFRFEKEPWREAVVSLDGAAPSSEPLLVHPPLIRTSYEYYAPGGRTSVHALVVDPETGIPRRTSGASGDPAAVGIDGGRIWLLLDRGILGARDEAILAHFAAAGWSRSVERHFGDIYYVALTR